MSAAGSVLLVGCGRLGSAIARGWLLSGAVDPRQLMIITPSSKPASEAARESGATINPSPESIARARTVVLAVKPAKWREVAAGLRDQLAADAVILSVMAGVGAADLAEGFSGREVVRVMPTTGVTYGDGAASVYAASDEARAVAHDLFEPMAATVDLPDEGLIDAATGVSGSGQAYVLAFVNALAAGGVAAGLDEATAARLARATLQSAAASLRADPRSPGELIAEVASPGGTTEAALNVLRGPSGLEPLLTAAVAAAVRRARELASS